MLGLWKRKPKVSGEIAYYQLESWWFSTFTDEQRQRAVALYQPMGSSPRRLIEGEIKWSSASRVKFLSGAAPWFSRPGSEKIAIAFADRLAAELGPTVPLVERHFAYQSLCRVYYRWRDVEPGSFNKAVAACEASIEMAHELGGTVDAPGALNPVRVTHYCYGQLIVIEKKRGRFDRAVELCQQAQEEGWIGDWGRTIASIKKMQLRLKKVGES